LLAGGRELALVNLLQATGADITNITECKIPEGTEEFSIAGYTTFSPMTRAGGKTQSDRLVENGLKVKANVKPIHNIMDPSIQLMWLHFDHQVISSGGRNATLGAFTLGGVYREWTPDLNRAELSQRLEILLSQICKAAEFSARVVFHGNLNVDVDRSGEGGFNMGVQHGGHAQVLV
jgi:hypothetical protein